MAIQRLATDRCSHPLSSVVLSRDFERILVDYSFIGWGWRWGWGPALFRRGWSQGNHVKLNLNVKLKSMQPVSSKSHLFATCMLVSSRFSMMIWCFDWVPAVQRRIKCWTRHARSDFIRRVVQLEYCIRDGGSLVSSLGRPEWPRGESGISWWFMKRPDWNTTCVREKNGKSPRCRLRFYSFHERHEDAIFSAHSKKIMQEVAWIKRNIRIMFTFPGNVLLEIQIM